MTSITQDSTLVSTDTWGLDPVHSDMGFAVTYSGAGTFRGSFDAFEASFADGNLEGSAKVASVRVDDPNLAGHLQSPDFFDAERNPELRFTSTSVERDGDDVSIAGELTIRGETKPVAITGKAFGPTPDAYGKQRIAFDIETTVDRRDFGISGTRSSRRATPRSPTTSGSPPTSRSSRRSVKILAISGSLRTASHNSELLREAAAIAPAGISVELYDGLKDVPPYDEDDDHGAQPAAVVRLKQALVSADAVLIATPEYNSSIPGVLKNALDWVSRPIVDSPLRNKPAAVIAASTGVFGAVWAAAETRKVLGTLGARVLEQTMSVPKAHERLAGDRDDLRVELLAVLEKLEVATRTRLAAAA